MDSALFTDRVWAGRAPLIVLLNVGLSLSRMSLFCVRACVCQWEGAQLLLPTHAVGAPANIRAALPT